jgi:tetratricopeptide (TPR) repeat protein
LLAQAFVGSGRSSSAFDALQRASALTPTSEKLYMYVADACMEQRDYALGLRVVDFGLAKLGQSARLHYERAMFLSLLDEFDRAKVDFQLARTLAPETEISYLAGAHEALYAGSPAVAARNARAGVSKGFQSSTLLTILGEALMRAGAHPGEPEFKEAQSALEKAVATQPRDANSHTSLGKLYLLANRSADAIAELEKARELSPENSAVYAPLAKAYQRHGEAQKSQEALDRLALLNQAQADKIASAPGDRKAGYSAPGRQQSDVADHH